MGNQNALKLHISLDRLFQDKDLHHFLYHCHDGLYLIQLISWPFSQQLHPAIPFLSEGLEANLTG
jgi:hypothetical protein